MLLCVPDNTYDDKAEDAHEPFQIQRKIKNKDYCEHRNNSSDSIFGNTYDQLNGGIKNYFPEFPLCRRR